MSALRFALSHRDETVALTREIIHAKPDDPRPAFVYDDAVAHKAVDPTLPIPAEKIQWIQEQMVKAGKLARAARSQRRHRAGISRKGAQAGRQARRATEVDVNSE